MADNDTLKKLTAGYHNQNDAFNMPETIVKGDNMVTNPYKQSNDMTVEDIYLYGTRIDSVKPLKNTVENDAGEIKPKYLMNNNYYIGNPSSKTLDDWFELDYKIENESLYKLKSDPNLNTKLAGIHLYHDVNAVKNGAVKHSIGIVNKTASKFYYSCFAGSLSFQIGNLNVDLMDSQNYYYRKSENGNTYYRCYFCNNNINPQSIYWNNITPYYDRQDGESDDELKNRMKMRSGLNMEYFELMNMLYCKNDVNNLISRDTNITKYNHSIKKVLDPLSRVEIYNCVNYSKERCDIPSIMFIGSFNSDRFDKMVNSYDKIDVDKWANNETLYRYHHRMSVNDDGLLSYSEHMIESNYYYYPSTLYDYIISYENYDDILTIYGKNVHCSDI